MPSVFSKESFSSFLYICPGMELLKHIFKKYWIMYASITGRDHFKSLNPEFLSQEGPFCCDPKDKPAEGKARVGRGQE